MMLNSEATTDTEAGIRTMMFFEREPFKEEKVVSNV